MSFADANARCAAAAAALGAAGAGAQLLVTAQIASVWPAVAVWRIPAGEGEVGRRVQVDGRRAPADFPTSVPSAQVPRLIVAAGAGCITVVVAAEVMAFAMLARHGDLVAYVRRHAPLPIDYHVPPWFLAIVVWASKIVVSSEAPADGATSVVAAAPDVVAVDLECMRMVFNYHDYADEEEALEEWAAAEFIETVECVPVLTVVSGAAAATASGGAPMFPPPASPPPSPPSPPSQAAPAAPSTPAAPTTSRVSTAAPTVAMFTRSKVRSAAGAGGGGDLARRL